jgi:hypothetical protein
MPLPTFAPPATPTPRPDTLTRTQAAARLELNPAGVDKLIKAGMLGLPIRAADVDKISGRERLQVLNGELTVLRTDARAEADRDKYPADPRRWMGFHVQHTDEELEAASLRWWRSDPHRVLDNELFAVTVATFPVAVYRILGIAGSITRADEDTPRHHYAGQLLARVHPGLETTFPQDTPGHLRTLAKQIMDQRIVVTSGGPVGYLEPTTDG